LIPRLATTITSGTKILLTTALKKKIKTYVMKKIFAMAFAAFSLAACNNDHADTTTVDMTDTTTVDTTLTTTTTSTAYTPAEGDVTYRDKNVMIYRNGQWVKTNEDVKMENGVVVRKSGKVEKEGKEVELKEGEVVNKTGNFFDKTGRAIDNAWDATKEGAKDAGRAVGNAAEKVGQKAKDVVDKDDNDEKH
jgi:hypothetical protein